MRVKCAHRFEWIQTLWDGGTRWEETGQEARRERNSTSTWARKTKETQIILCYLKATFWNVHKLITGSCSPEHRDNKTKSIKNKKTLPVSLIKNCVLSWLDSKFGTMFPTVLLQKRAKCKSQVNLREAQFVNTAKPHFFHITPKLRSQLTGVSGLINDGEEKKTLSNPGRTVFLVVGARQATIVLQASKKAYWGRCVKSS